MKTHWKLKPLLLDRYVFRSFFSTFVAASFLFVCILLLFDMFNQINYFLTQKTDIGEILGMYFHKSFFQFTMVSPAACLFSAIYTVNKLAKDNELIAIINSGMSIYRLTISLVLFGLVFSVGMIYFNDLVVFPSERIADQISDQIRRRTQKNKSQNDVKVWGTHGVFYKAMYYNDRRKELRKLIVLKRQEQKLSGEDVGEGARMSVLSNRPPGSFDGDWSFLDDVRPLQSRSVWLFRIECEYARYDKRRKGWVLYNGRIRKYDRAQEINIPFKQRFFPFKETPYDFSKELDKVTAMTTAESERYIEKLIKSGKPYRRELVEHYLKFSLPLVNFIIIIIGIAFGGFSPKSVVLLSFFIAVLVYLIYYTFVALGISMGKMGTLSPLMGAWLGNIAFFVAGIVLLIYRKT